MEMVKEDTSVILVDVSFIVDRKKWNTFSS